MMKWVEKWNRWMDATDETNYTATMLSKVQNPNN